MYQVYTLPKYIEYGKKFFEGVNERYTEYAKQLEPKIGIPHTVITPLIFIFVRACVHYAMFEDEYYLKTQMEVLKQAVALFADKYRLPLEKLREEEKEERKEKLQISKTRGICFSVHIVGQYGSGQSIGSRK